MGAVASSGRIDANKVPFWKPEFESVLLMRIAKCFVDDGSSVRSLWRWGRDTELDWEIEQGEYEWFRLVHHCLCDSRRSVSLALSSWGLAYLIIFDQPYGKGIKKKVLLRLDELPLRLTESEFQDPIGDKLLAQFCLTSGGDLRRVIRADGSRDQTVLDKIKQEWEMECANE